MRTMPVPQIEESLAELLGTFLQVSARSAPPSYSLRQVADRFQAWAAEQPVVRLGHVYNHLVAGQLDPMWDELGLAGPPA